MSELECTFVSTHGLRRSCDEQILSLNEPNIVFRCKNLQRGQTLYVTGFSLKGFLDLYWKCIQQPIVLVTGTQDESFPDALGSLFEPFVNNSHLLHWFGQNLKTTHPKCTRIPIGLDYHTLAGHLGLPHQWGPGQPPVLQEETLKLIRSKQTDWQVRHPVAFCNWHFFAERGDRKEALNKIDPSIHIKSENYLSRAQTWAIQSQVCFVTSPQGNGLDCHRTWEALVLGCVPIVKDTDSIWDGLPVWTIEDWSEVTESACRQKKQEFSLRLFEFQSEKLTLAYWIKRIEAVKH